MWRELWDQWLCNTCQNPSHCECMGNWKRSQLLDWSRELLPRDFLDSSVDYKGVNFEFIPFGAGRRICPGITFATPNVELPLAQLLYHFDWKLPTKTKHEDLDMTENFGATVRRKNDLYLTPIPYHPMPLNWDLKEDDVYSTLANFRNYNSISFPVYVTKKVPISAL